MLKLIFYRGIVFTLILTNTLFLLACSHNPPRIESKTYDNQSWPNVKTYMFSKDSKLANEELAGVGITEIRQKIESSIREELTLRNIQEVNDADQADITITYLGASIMRVGMQQEGEAYSESATVGSATHTDIGFSGRSMVDFNEGALVIVATDPKTGEDLWQGRAITHLKVDVSQEKRDLLIGESIQKIFEQFPQ